jgi:hypothetical protein
MEDRDGLQGGNTQHGAVYRARNPRASPLYQCVRRHYDELEAGGAIHRQVERRVLDRFIDCGDLHKGFARIYCDDCGHDYLLAFSCKTRYFCPSCHQKRMLSYGDWVEEFVAGCTTPLFHAKPLFEWNRFRESWPRGLHQQMKGAEGGSETVSGAMANTWVGQLK